MYISKIFSGFDLRWCSLEEPLWLSKSCPLASMCGWWVLVWTTTERQVKSEYTMGYFNMLRKVYVPGFILMLLNMFLLKPRCTKCTRKWLDLIKSCIHTWISNWIFDVLYRTLWYVRWKETEWLAAEGWLLVWHSRTPPWPVHSVLEVRADCLRSLYVIILHNTVNSIAGQSFSNRKP